MFEKEYGKTLEFCLMHLVSTEQLVAFLKTLGFTQKLVGTKKDIIKKLKVNRSPVITLDTFRAFCYDNWERPDVKMHIKNLKSGILNGHSWHGAMPSMLHLSLQGKVRNVCSGDIKLSDLIKIGGDITKHEYFMVAVADICEDLIIREFDATPSIISKGVSDFVFNGYPFDLKNTTLPNAVKLQYATKHLGQFAKFLFNNADTERIRKNAKGSINNWANNRFYVVAKNEIVWTKDPDETLNRLRAEIEKLKKPMKINVGGRDLLCYVVFV